MPKRKRAAAGQLDLFPQSPAKPPANPVAREAFSAAAASVPYEPSPHPRTSRPSQYSLFNRPAVPRTAGDRAYDFSLLRQRKHPLRDYQTEAMDFALQNRNAIICLGTNTGKTEIEFHLAAEALKRGKVILVADTVLLCKQHHDLAIGEAGFNLREAEIVRATGDNAARKKDRAGFYREARLIIGTPETLARDVANGHLSLADVALVVMDEVHNARGNDDYVTVANACLKHGGIPRVGLSASPAETKAKLQALLDLFQTEAVFTADEREMQRYFSKPSSARVYVELEDGRKRALAMLKQLGASISGEMSASAQTAGLTALLANYARLSDGFEFPRYSELTAGERILEASIKKHTARGDTYTAASKALYNARSAHAALFALTHAYACLERISTVEFRRAASILDKKAVAGAKFASRIVDDRLFAGCREMCEGMADHPKLDFVLERLGDTEGQALIFVDTKMFARRLAKMLNESGFSSRALVGKSGMSAATQMEIRQLFERGDVRVLVATTVAEQGLHLPMLKLLINYSAPSSLISTEQRNGRVRCAGHIYTLLCDDTADLGIIQSVDGRRRSMNKRYAAMA